MIVRLAVVAVATILLPTASQAAMLQEIQGVVLIDRGGGFDSVEGPTQLNPGDSVIVNPGGSAHVVYPDGCRVPVQPGAVVGVNKHSPCSNAEQGVVAEGDQGGGFNTTNLLIGGAVVALGAGAAILLIADDDETPASP
jgi:hypothetical protein